MKSYNVKKDWFVCSQCDKSDPCMMYLPKTIRKQFPKDYCFLQDTKDGMKGKWHKPAWSKTELTV
jgi:hypothetical protein